MEIRSSCALVLILAACGSSDSPSKVTVTEAIPAGEEGDIVVTLHREGGSGALTIPFTTREESATGDVDFALAEGEVEWEDDDMEDKTITVTLLDDVTIEPAESFVIEIGKPSNDSKIDKSVVPVTITDDDHQGD